MLIYPGITSGPSIFGDIMNRFGIRLRAVAIQYTAAYVKRRKNMKLKCILAFMVVLTLGTTACSSDSREDAVHVETMADQEAENTNVSEPETRSNAMEQSKSEITENVETESASDGESTVSDPITGIVEKYADEMIVIKDPSDGILYYFSTKNALIIEEADSPVAVGDQVEITYQGLLGDETHPAEAVKIEQT